MADFNVNYPDATGKTPAGYLNYIGVVAVHTRLNKAYRIENIVYDGERDLWGFLHVEVDNPNNPNPEAITRSIDNFFGVFPGTLQRRFTLIRKDAINQAPAQESSEVSTEDLSEEASELQEMLAADTEKVDIQAPADIDCSCPDECPLGDDE